MVGSGEMVGRKEELDYKGPMRRVCVVWDSSMVVLTQISPCDVCIDITYTYTYTHMQVKSAKSE